MFITFTPQDVRDKVDEELKDTPQVRPATRGLMVNFILDLPLSLPQSEDFGVTSADHYRALHEVMDALVEKCGIVGCALELDQAMGNGPQLTQLVKTYAPEYEVTFLTTWDLIYGRA